MPDTRLEALLAIGAISDPPRPAFTPNSGKTSRRVNGSRLGGTGHPALCFAAMREATSETTVGQRLALQREEAGLSKRRLSAISGIPIRQIQEWESDRHEPTVKSLKRLIPHIGGSVVYYLDLEDDQ